MSEKKKAGWMIGTILVAGVAAGVYKYLKDYYDVEFAKEEQIKNVKNSSREVGNAAKRTYIAIKDKDKEDVKAAAGELTKATGNVISDAVDVAVAAGASTVNAIKDIKNKYDEDPEETRTEMADNLSDMAQDISMNVLNAAGNLIDKIKSNIGPEGNESGAADGCEAHDGETCESAGEAAEVFETAEAAGCEDADAGSREAEGESAEADGSERETAADEAGQNCEEAPEAEPEEAAAAPAGEETAEPAGEDGTGSVEEAAAGPAGEESSASGAGDKNTAPEAGEVTEDYTADSTEGEEIRIDFDEDGDFKATISEDEAG